MGRSLEFYYPSVLERKDHYLVNSVLIEFGARNVTEPNEKHVIRPYLANHVDNVSLPTANISALSPLRTFWEKSYISACRMPS